MTSLDTPAGLAAGARAQAPAVTHRRSRSQATGRWWRELGWRHLVGVLAVLFALFPALYAVSSSLNPVGTLVASRLVPPDPTVANYQALFRGQIPYRAWLTNSLLIAGGAAVANTFLSALAAYAFSRMQFLGRRVGILTILLVQMFPQALAFVAIFVMISDLGNVFPAIGLGERPALFLVYLGGAMGVNTWLMKGYFDTIPRDLDESALVDGATHGQIFFRVILPLAAPVLAVVALLTFVFLFNDFVIASAVLGQGDSDNFTLAVGLFQFVDNRASRWGLFTAGSVLAAIPIVVLFQFLQRYIVSGLTSGAVKG